MKNYCNPNQAILDIYYSAGIPEKRTDTLYNTRTRSVYDAKKLGRIIREKRVSQKLSQISVADLANINHSYYCNIENGKANMTVKKMISICRCLEVPPHELLQSLCVTESTERH